MHSTDSRSSSAEMLGPPPPVPSGSPPGRPWDYDTEDSGVDSVSSVVGLETDNTNNNNGGGGGGGIGPSLGGSVEYAQVIVHTTSDQGELAGTVGRKSFLHTVYGRPLDFNANTSGMSRVYDDLAEKTPSSTTSSVDTAKNSFLNSLLLGVQEPDGTKVKAPALDDLLPELVQLLDAGRSDGGLVELISRDGTRASLRISRAPSNGQSVPVTVTASRKSSFNRAGHRNSKRSSQRRTKSNASSTPSGSAPAVQTSATAAAVRRRPSAGKKTVSASELRQPTSNKVATLASKFNSLITSAGGVSSLADKATAGLSAGRLKRSPSTKPAIDTIPEVTDQPEQIECATAVVATTTSTYCNVPAPRRRSHDLAVPSSKHHSAVRPLPSDPGGGKSHSVYGTVKSIVKQAIRKFEKLDGAASSDQQSAGQQRVPSTGDMPAQQEFPVVAIPEGIEPNSSFLWRDQRSMQNLIYEATGFNERAAASSCGRSESSYYDIGNAYDALLHHNKSSSSSSNGYDEIQAPTTTTTTVAKHDGTASKEPSVRYDDIMKPPTYDELSFTNRRKCSNGYDELQSTTSSGGYIDPGSSSALGYERILPSPKLLSETDAGDEEEDGSTLRYEECGSPPTNVQLEAKTIHAVPAIVSEDQLDSISYLYDDIRAGGGGATRPGGDGGHAGGCAYGGSQYSYEPIYAHLGDGHSNPATSTLDISKSCDTLSGSSEEGVHEVCSYRLTHMGQQNVPDSPAPSLAGSSSTQTKTGPQERRSETSDEWIDISDGDPEEPAWTVTRVHQIQEPVNASFVRRGHRTSRRKLSIPKSSQQSWSETMRSLVRNGFNKATTLSKRTGKNVLADKKKRAQTFNLGATAAIPSAAAVEPVQLKSSARRLPSVESRGTEASGTGSSQTWEDCGESDGDDLVDDHHYEALYEVINPTLQRHAAARSGGHLHPLDPQDDSFDDSFDSDDAFEEVVVRGLDTTSDTSRERPGSRSGSERSKESEDPSIRSSGHGQNQQYGISRFADLAGEQMRKLRRNWSTTKTDIGRSITRIKKKSTASVADLSEVFKPLTVYPQQQYQKRDASLEKGSGDAPAHSPDRQQPPSRKKGTWALRQIRRRMTVSPANGSGAGKSGGRDASTFYLTLTIEQEKLAPTSDNNKSPAASQTSSPTPAGSTPSPVPPLVTPSTSGNGSTGNLINNNNTSKLPARPRRTSSAAGHLPQPTVRPKTAPPAPPIKAAATDVPAAVPAKKPLSRLTTAFSESRLAVEKSQLMDDYQSTQYCDIAISPTSPSDSRPNPSTESEPSLLGTTYSRLSLASNASRHSSDTYITVGDVASAPERRLSQHQSPENGRRNYMDLQPPFESEELYMSSHFADEPLYQFYTAAIIERAANNQGEVSEEDDYEVIGEHRRKEELLAAAAAAKAAAEQQERERRSSTNKLPTAMELVTPLSGRRTLWCELPQVIGSGLLERITPQQRKLQEAMFELITSEASYLRSLNVLTTHFIQSSELTGTESPVLSRLERHTLFSDILPVRECSEALLTDLEKRWQENVLIREICDILLEHASKHFEVYIKYCTNQLYQERMLRELKENKPQFVEVLKRLEASPVCQSLAMHSFLMLPMQRITRLPLLVDAIFHRLESGSPEFERCRMTLATLNKIVQECNEGARKAERIHEMLVVSNQLDFADVKAISVMSASRWLVKKGELQRLMWRDIDARLTFGRKIHKQTVYVFLFTDLLVITKKKGEDSFAVLDYCPRNMVQVEEHARMEKPLGKPGSEMGKNLILLTMLQNHENKTVEMILSCSSESDRTRWLEAVTPRTSDNPEEKIYEEWDCPQVQAVHPYVATQPDELSLEVADVVNVTRKMADGWYQGERLRDDERGWFPGNYTVEIASSHVRARNLRQRYRLLALSGSFIEEQARKDREENKRKSKKMSITE